ncbi:MAG: tellurite resistance TerB family protein [Aliihoeflea sp.]
MAKTRPEEAFRVRETATRLSPQEAMVYIMVITSAADRDMGDEELARIGAIVRTLPLFDGFDQAGTLRVAQNCQKALTAEGGLTDVLEAIRLSLTPRLRETAYALAVDVAAIDLDIREEEDRILDIVKARFSIDPLAAAAIERAAAIRHRVED